MKYLISTLITSLAFGILMTAPPVLAQTPDDGCAGTVGAGYGLCTAASHLGCGTDLENNTNACTKIEDKFVTITGELPPWLAPPQLLCWMPDDQHVYQCAGNSSANCPEGCKIWGYNPTTQTETCSCYNK